MSEVLGPDEPGKQRASDSQPDSALRYVYLPLAAVQPGHEVNILSYWRVILNRKAFVISGTLLVTLIAALIMFLMAPVYVAEIGLLFKGPTEVSSGDSGSGREGGREESTQEAATSGSQEEAIAVFESRLFTNAFIQERNLLPELFADDWDKRTKSWKPGVAKRPPDLWDAYKLFDEKVREVETDRSTGLTIVSIRWKSAELAAEWANALAAKLNDHLRERDGREAKKQLAYLHNLLAETGVVELREPLYDMIESNTRIEMLTHISDEYAFRIVDPAVPPKFQVWGMLKRAVVVVAASVFGLVLSVVLVLLSDMLRRQRAKEAGELSDR